MPTTYGPPSIEPEVAPASAPLCGPHNRSAQAVLSSFWGTGTCSEFIGISVPLLSLSSPVQATLTGLLSPSLSLPA